MDFKTQQNLHLHASSPIIPQFIKNTNCLQLLQSTQLKVTKTKKICTLGPKSSSVEILLSLMDQGMNVARLNFSHGSHDSHAKFVDLIHLANKTHPSKKLSILLDTKGPQIRTGKNLDGKTILLTKGHQLEITIDYNFPSTNKRIACSYSELIDSVQIGSSVLFSDGQISSVVKRIDQDNKIVVVEVLNDGKLGQKKNMCLPGCVVKLPTINPYDENDIVNFGLVHKVDFIAVSFARYRSDIEYIRKILAKQDPNYAQQVRIISKIQNRQALQNIDQIISASDGIMVARGDLGMETPLEKLILLQKLITMKCLNTGKFVIVATQMVQSMQTKPRPTRAEVSDIANAVLDMVDCTMTSGETANGEFPVETVSYMNRISIEAQNACDYERLFAYRLRTCLQLQQSEQALKVSKIVEQSFTNKSQAILFRNDNPRLVSLLSSYRPSGYIFVFSQQPQKMRRLTALNYGVYVFDEEQYPKCTELLKGIKEEFGFGEKVNVLMAELQISGLITCISRQIHLTAE